MISDTNSGINKIVNEQIGMTTDMFDIKLNLKNTEKTQTKSLLQLVQTLLLSGTHSHFILLRTGIVCEQFF